MPADFFIDTKLGIVFSKAVGTCGRPEIIDHMDRLQRHPDFRPELNQLFDFRGVTRVTFTAGDVRALATRNIFSGHSRRALVVESDSHYGLARMFEAHREMEGERGITIFRDMPSALSWLSLAAEPDPGLFHQLATAAPAGD